MGVNLLGEGRKTLEELLVRVESLTEAEREEQALFESETMLEEKIEGKEKQILSEISETIQKRRKELEASFQVEEEKIEKLTKQLQGKREKARSGKVSERIEAETEQFYLKNKEIKRDTWQLFKQNKAPKLLNTGIYYTLFAPQSFWEVLICGILFLLLFGGLPYFLWNLQAEPRGEVSLILIYLGTIFVFGGLYFLIFSQSRAKYGDTIALGKIARGNRRRNRKTAKRIEKNIKKDKDDSGYGLQDYDSGLSDLRLQTEEIRARKKEALRGFEEETKRVITEETKNLHEAELMAMKEELSEKTALLGDLRERIKGEKLSLSENYETYLGKEVVCSEEIRNLLNLMEVRGLSTIGEALEARKQGMSEEERNG